MAGRVPIALTWNSAQNPARSPSFKKTAPPPTFAFSGGVYVPSAWVQATLVKEGTNYVFTLPYQEKLKFNSEGKLIEQKDRNSNRLVFFYSSGKLIFVENEVEEEERYLSFAYTGSQVTSISDRMGHKVKYAYESGNLISVTLPGEETPRWKFKYDASHQMTEMTDGRGGIVKTEYDEKHRVKKQTDPMERVTKFLYSELEGVKRRRSPSRMDRRPSRSSIRLASRWK